MTSPVTKAMIESYALMVMIMGTFFVYFCGMVWAFCNPKLSGTEDECETGTQTNGNWEHSCPSAPGSPQRTGSARIAAPGTLITQTTYLNFWDDNDSLLSHNAACNLDDLGITNQMAESSSWTI